MPCPWAVQNAATGMHLNLTLPDATCEMAATERHAEAVYPAGDSPQSAKLPSSPRQHRHRLLQMWRVDHLAVQLECACAGVGFERGDYGAGVGQVGFAGGEGGVDDGDLSGVDGHDVSHAPASTENIRLPMLVRRCV